MSLSVIWAFVEANQASVLKFFTSVAVTAFAYLNHKLSLGFSQAEVVVASGAVGSFFWHLAEKLEAKVVATPAAPVPVAPAPAPTVLVSDGK